MAASRLARRAFIEAATDATWNLGKERHRQVERMFREALDKAFGPLPAPTKELCDG